MKQLVAIRAFITGVVDAYSAGTLSMGMTYDDLSLSAAYDNGANVGEWLWDLFHGYSVKRYPWVQRRSGL